jgi:hypothetical protein
MTNRWRRSGAIELPNLFDFLLESSEGYSPERRSTEPKEPHMGLNIQIEYNKRFKKWVVHADYINPDGWGAYNNPTVGDHICDSRDEAVEWAIGYAATWTKMDEERRARYDKKHNREVGN